jgi:hypothetical protein
MEWYLSDRLSSTTLLINKSGLEKSSAPTIIRMDKFSRAGCRSMGSLELPVK